MHPIGGGTIPQSVISPEDIERIQQEVSSLTVKNTAPAPLTPFVPAYLAYDKKRCSSSLVTSRRHCPLASRRTVPTTVTGLSRSFTILR